MHGDYLLLDPAIRDWVVLPMIYILVLVGIGRHYVQELIKSEPLITLDSVEELKNKQTLFRASRLRMCGGFLPEASFHRRKMFYTRKGVGALNAKVPGATNPMNNPMGMVDMMKGNMIFMIPNIVMMGFVSSFFAGFVCVKVPFTMPSNRFKVMMQRGVDLNTLDVSYVSSLSWYFLVTFGLSGVYQLILGADVQSDETRMMQMQMGGMGGGQQPGFDASAAFRFEKDQLKLTKYVDLLEKAEQELLGPLRYPQPQVEGLDLSKFKTIAGKK